MYSVKPPSGGLKALAFRVYPKWSKGDPASFLVRMWRCNDGLKAVTGGQRLVRKPAAESEKLDSSTAATVHLAPDGVTRRR